MTDIKKVKATPMKKIILVIILLQCKLFAQQAKDTVFLQKKQGYDIFIDPNKNSVHYRNIEESFKVFPNEELKNIGLNNNWVPLYKYNEVYYVYSSCDCFNPIIKLTNKETFLNCFEISSFKNCKIKATDKDFFEISYKNTTSKKNKIKINYIDKKRTIAIFEFINEKKEVHYLLMTALENIKDFPIIVNDCKFGKAKEFEFPPINYQKLLKEKL